MTVYTIGFTQKTAEQFFTLLRKNHVELLIDVRLNNKSQLAGFTKGPDLAFFLREICNAEYLHCDEFAPSKDLLSSYQKKLISWDEYERRFDLIMEKRGTYLQFLSKYNKFARICLLCSEPTAAHCHRRLVAEKIQYAFPNEVEVIHL